MNPIYKEGVVDLLESAVNCKLENFEVQVHGENEKGEGFLSEMTFVSLKNKKTGKDYNLIIKMARSNNETGNSKDFMSFSFRSEIHCYTKIFPAFLKFQNFYPEVKSFDNLPKCYATCSDEGFEKFALENLKMQGYELHPKSEIISTKSYETIFKMYGEFHALSFAFKHHQPEEFSRLTKNLTNNWLKFNESDYARNIVSHFLGKIIVYLKEEAEYKIIEKLEKYRTNFANIFNESVTCSGSDRPLLHGDCWSNNLMLKFDSTGEIQHIKMIDFQMSYLGTPVRDLSYSLYSGAGKETLDNLENLLKLYHNTLSETLIKYGCNPEKIYPYEILKKEWKEYCCFGYLSSTLIWVFKTSTDLSEMPTVSDLMDENSEETINNDFGIKFNRNLYKKVTLDLIKHLYENDFL